MNELLAVLALTGIATIFAMFVVGVPLLVYHLLWTLPDRREQRRRNGRPGLNMRASGGRLVHIEVHDPRDPEFRR